MALKTDPEGQLLRQVLTIKPVLDSVNRFYDHYIDKILSSYKIYTNGGRVCKFSSPSYKKPDINDLEGGVRPLYPQEARRKNLNYMATLYATLQLYDTRGNPIQGESVKVCLGKIPAILHSVACNLHGLTPQERYKHGEGEADPGCYAIIRGNEKVLLNIENLRSLEPFLYYDKDKYVVRYTSQTLIDTSVNVVYESDDIMYTTFSAIGIATKKLNIFLVFYALGLEQNTVDEAIKIMEYFVVDEDPKRQERRRKELRYYLHATITSFLVLGDPITKQGVYDAIKNILDDKPKKPKKKKKDEEEKPKTAKYFVDLIRREFLANIQSEKVKILMLAAMVAKYVDFSNGYRKADDRDAWGNKQLVDAGRHLARQFSKIWKDMVAELEEAIKKKNYEHASAIKSAIETNKLGDDFIKAYTKNQWYSSRDKKEVAVSDILKRDNILAAISHIRRITTPTNRKGKTREKRLIHNSQWGVICPVMTPEGDACGIVKEPAITTYVSLEYDEIPKDHLDYRPYPQGKYKYPLYVNGVVYGFCDSVDLHKDLVERRRAGAYHIGIGIILGEHKELKIYTSAGRVCRPLLVVDEASQRLVIDIKDLWDKDIHTLVKEGAIEYIDSAEQEQPYIHIADRRTRLRPDSRYTHCEIDPTVILGVSSIVSPFPEYNPGPRNTYQASMGRQALGGADAVRVDLRFDTSIKTILEPGVPVVATDAHEYLGLDEYPTTRQVVIAITTYGGSNQEDALTFNKGAVDRGLFMMTIYHSFKTTVSNDITRIERLELPEHPATAVHKYSKLDPATNIVRVGEYVKTGDCLVAKTSEDTTTRQKRDASLYVEVGKEGTVEEVYVTETIEGGKLIKIRIREMRKLQPGDKLASRYSQKGVIGAILPETQFPWISSDNPYLDGVRPHVIFNPISLPSRMTMGKMYEILYGKAMGLLGERYNATAFRRFDPHEFLDWMVELGFTRTGKEVMVNGVTGATMEAEIFVGTVAYQLLRHLVKDKMQARGTGMLHVMTHQPVSGIRKGGGLRFGEMERDALIEHGTGHLLQERLCISSDAYKAIVCNQCGAWAIYNVDREDIMCRNCPVGDFRKLQIPYVYKLLTHFLAGANIKVKPTLRDI